MQPPEFHELECPACREHQPCPIVKVQQHLIEMHDRACPYECQTELIKFYSGSDPLTGGPIVSAECHYGLKVSTGGPIRVSEMVRDLK